MTTIASKRKESKNQMLLCHFFNHRNQIVIARISNIPNWYLERVVFPAQRFLFEAPEEAVLEIHSPDQRTIHEDTIPCRDLCITQEDSNN